MRGLARRSGPGLAGRLFAAQALVVLTGAATLGLVAALVGPAIFHEHLSRVPGRVEGEAAGHVEEAYASASAVSLSVALFAALVAALAVSAYLARRVARPVGQVAAAAADIADGHYDIRLTAPRLGREFDTVAAAFNAMAARLADVETTRRRLLGDLSHELRTPIATIEAYLDAAEDGIDVAGEDTYAVLRAQTSRLRRLADDVAAVSKAEEHQLELRRQRVSVTEVVSRAVAAARARYEAGGVMLHERVAADLPLIEVDVERMGQVLGNLLDNALRHTPAGGQVVVGAGLDPAGVRITVTDTGEGIAAEDLPHVFERFYRAHTGRGGARPAGSGERGSGIGLSIVRAIVTDHGGRVTATSGGSDTGTTLSVTLPAAAR